MHCVLIKVILNVTIDLLMNTNISLISTIMSLLMLRGIKDWQVMMKFKQKNKCINLHKLIEKNLEERSKNKKVNILKISSRLVKNL